MEVAPFTPGEKVVVQLGPAFVPARIVAVIKGQVDVICGRGRTTRTLSVMHVFRPSPQLEALMAKISEPGVTQWDLSPLLKVLYDSHPGINAR